MKFIDGGSLTNIVNSAFSILQDFLNGSFLFEIIDLLFDFSAFLIDHGLAVHEKKRR